jgi:purine-binding chemotaxis protein CheW
VNSTLNIGSTQILRFQLAGSQYAFDVLSVREILTMVKITPLPTAAQLSGVINLRGSVIPVVDLRRQFQLAVTAETVDTAIVILEISAGDSLAVVGVIVDAVLGVARCEASDSNPPPKFGMSVGAQFVESIAKLNDEFVIVLDADRLFSDAVWEHTALGSPE